MYFYYVYLFLPHSPTICASCFHSPQLPDVLSLYFSLWQTCITWLSLIFFFSSPSLFTRCHCCLFFFKIHPYCLLPMLSSLPLVALCLRYFVWLTSVTARLCLVFCFVYVVSLGLLSFPVREWIHIHVSVLWKTLFIFYSLRPPRETNNLRIKCTH